MAESDVERLEVGALSETGYVRDENQDRMSGSVVPLGHLYIVADGMGGHKAGALAAQMAVEELQRYIAGAAASDPADAVIAAAFKAANEAVYKRSHAGDSATEGMGTTAVLLLISGRVGKVAHVGDSRAYLYRHGSLSQLTTDHTIVQRMVEAGMLKPEEAANHPQSSMLERAIGSTQTVQVDISNHQLEPGDALLLCSDGLSGYVSDAQIEDVLRDERPVQETTADLVRLALDKGGRDNVTVQVVRCGPRAAPSAPAAAAPPAVRQTRPTKIVTPPAPTSGRGAQAPRKPGGTRPGVLAAAVAVVGVAAGSAFLYLSPSDPSGNAGSRGLAGSEVAQPVAPSGAQPQPSGAGESTSAVTRAPAVAPQPAPPASVVPDSPEALRDRLNKREQELAATQQKLTAKEQELADARKKIADLEGRLKELAKAPARGAPQGAPKAPDSVAPKATPDSAPKASAKPGGTPPASPAATGPTQAGPSTTPAGTPETWVPATPQSGAAPPSAPAAPPAGGPEPPPVKPASEGG